MKVQEGILAKVLAEPMHFFSPNSRSAKEETAVSHVSVPCSSKTAQQHCDVSTTLHSISIGLGYDMSHAVGVIASGSTS